MKTITQEKFDDLVSDKVEEILESDEFKKGFDDGLDEIGEPCKVGNLEYSQSQVLKNCDPSAYRVRLHDHQEEERVQITHEIREVLEREYEIKEAKQ